MDTPKTKPDMLAASPQAGGGKRILAALEHGAKPAAKPARATAWTIDGWTAGLGLLLMVMLGAAWMMHGETSVPPAVRHSDGGAGERPIATAPHVQTPPAPAAGQAAAIVNESPTAGASAALAATDMGRPGVTVQNPPLRGVQPPHKQAPAGSGTATRAPQTATARNTAAASAGERASTAASATRDTDVTLLTALVAHANKPTVTVAERSRDVVERQEGDTTAQLLARCQQLGLIEGMLCRSRICSGRWDQDAACRAPAH